MTDTLGERVKRLRQERGMSGAQLAKAVGIRENAIWKIEGDLVKNPGLATSVRLARSLGVSTAYLAGLERETAPDLTIQLEDGAIIGVEIRVHSHDSSLSSAAAEEIVLQRVTGAIGPGAQIIGTRKLSEAGVSLAPPHLDLHQLPPEMVSPVVASLRDDLEKTMQRVDDLTWALQQVVDARKESLEEAEQAGATPQSRKRAGHR